jgi:hypothetical protein
MMVEGTSRLFRSAYINWFKQQFVIMQAEVSKILWCYTGCEDWPSVTVVVCLLGVHGRRYHQYQNLNINKKTCYLPSFECFKLCIE